MFTVEVIYATLTQQQLFSVACHLGDTVSDAIVASGILEKFPEIDLEKNKVGVFNQLIKLTDPVKINDRIEIYRPLIANPKEVRRKRAVQQKAEGVIK